MTAIRPERNRDRRRGLERERASNRESLERERETERKKDELVSTEVDLHVKL